MDLLRLFVAVHIEPTAPLRNLLRKLSLIGRPVRAVTPDQLHLTLAFLGDTPAEAVEGIASILAETVAESRTGPMRVTLSGLGAFPAPRRPKVVWAGLSPAEPLRTLAQRLQEKLAAARWIEPDDRPFQPHLTLARVRLDRRRPTCPPVTAMLEAHSDADLGRASIDAIHLVHSQLHREGPIYRTLHTVKLEG